jgi:hypothetical protein
MSGSRTSSREAATCARASLRPSGPFDAGAVERFLADTDAITQRYFPHPRYPGYGTQYLEILRSVTGR